MSMSIAVQCSPAKLRHRQQPLSAQKQQAASSAQNDIQLRKQGLPEASGRQTLFIHTILPMGRPAGACSVCSTVLSGAQLLCNHMQEGEEAI